MVLEGWQTGCLLQLLGSDLDLLEFRTVGPCLALYGGRVPCFAFDIPRTQANYGPARAPPQLRQETRFPMQRCGTASVGLLIYAHGTPATPSHTKISSMPGCVEGSMTGTWSQHHKEATCSTYEYQNLIRCPCNAPACLPRTSSHGQRKKKQIIESANIDYLRGS